VALIDYDEVEEVWVIVLIAKPVALLCRKGLEDREED
jgi:hypothetical protein